MLHDYEAGSSWADVCQQHVPKSALRLKAKNSPSLHYIDVNHIHNMMEGEIDQLICQLSNNEEILTTRYS